MADIGLTSFALAPLAQQGGSFWFPPEASTVAAGHDFTYEFVLWLCLVFFAAICGATLYFMIKYRRRPGHKEERTITHHTKLEIAWSVIPLFLLMFIFGFGTYWYLEMITPPNEDLEQIDVTAQRWSWTFKYEGGDFDKTYMTPNLHVMIDKPYQLVMTTPDNDVLHSLFIPAFRVKQDCVPGRYNKLWFQPTMLSPEPSEENPLGGFDLFCTEYCGTNHSNMITKVYVYDDEAKWMAAIIEDGYPFPPDGKVTPQAGEKIYNMYCKSCHSVDGSDGIGPTWKGLWGTKHETKSGKSVVVDDSAEGKQYLRESVLTPDKEIVDGYANSMTPFTWGEETEKYLEAIRAYMKSLEE